MSIYTVLLILTKIVQMIFVVLFAFLTYKPTKEIIIKNIKQELSDFHSEYLQNNYHLELANINSLDKINEAMEQIKAEPEFFDRIPEGEILATKMFMSILNKYSFYQKSVLYLIGLTMSIELGISVGVSLL